MADEKELPEPVIEKAERLTRRARAATDPEEGHSYRADRDSILEEHGFTARIRDDDDVLVLHPEEWVEDGTIQIEAISDVDRAIEVPLSGEGDEGWETIEAHNRRIARLVRERYGDVHGDTADAFADFMGNHHLRRIETATEREYEEFCTEYFVRNAWPTDEQKSNVERSLSLIRAVAKKP